MAHTILLIEDDDDIAALLQHELEHAGFVVLRESDGGLALAALDRCLFDIVLLDLMLPGADGFDVCRHLQARHPQIPVIIISARSAEEHRVLGLESGADDYLVKPFSTLELVARVRAQLRRIELLRALPRERSIQLSPQITLDAATRELRIGNRGISLTMREFHLLEFLASHPGQVFSRAQLLDRIWGQGFDGYEHTVNSHINRLRQKLESDPDRPRLIQTVWGVGYRLSGGLREAPA